LLFVIRVCRTVAFSTKNNTALNITHGTECLAAKLHASVTSQLSASDSYYWLSATS